ncbi:hypothetical protein JCM17961_20580 [Endothiovibrio diazotrophicus]
MKKTLIALAITLLIQTTASARTLSFDQFIADDSTLTCWFKKSDSGHVEFEMRFGHGVSIVATSFISSRTYTIWEDTVPLAKKVAEYIREHDHINPIEMLTGIGLPNVRERHN